MIKVALQRRAILYVYHKKFMIVNDLYRVEAIPWSLDFGSHTFSDWFLALFATVPLETFKKRKTICCKSDRTVEVTRQVLMRAWVDAPASPNPP